MRLEQEYRRRRIFVFGAGLVAHRLRDHAGLLREMGGVRMIEIVRILERVREHERWVEFAVDIDHAVEMRFVELERIVAAIEELDLGAEQGGGAFGLVLAAGFDFLKRRAGFLPGELAFAAFAIGQADDFDL